MELEFIDSNELIGSRISVGVNKTLYLIKDIVTYLKIKEGDRIMIAYDRIYNNTTKRYIYIRITDEVNSMTHPIINNNCIFITNILDKLIVDIDMKKFKYEYFYVESVEYENKIYHKYELKKGSIIKRKRSNVILQR